MEQSQPPQNKSIIIQDKDGSQWRVPYEDAQTLFPTLCIALNNEAPEDQEKHPTIYLADCDKARCSSDLTLLNLQLLQGLHKHPLPRDTVIPNINSLFELAQYCGSPEPLLKRLAFRAFRSLPRESMHPDMHGYGYSLGELIDHNIITNIGEYVEKDMKGEYSLNLSHMHIKSLEGMQKVCEEIGKYISHTKDIPKPFTGAYYIPPNYYIPTTITKIILDNNILNKVNIDNLQPNYRNQLFSISLQHLSLSNNHIQTITSPSATSLINIDLSGNQLNTVPLIVCQNINLRHNPLSFWEYAQYYKNNIEPSMTFVLLHLGLITWLICLYPGLQMRVDPNTTFLNDLKEAGIAYAVSMVTGIGLATYLLLPIYQRHQHLIRPTISCDHGSVKGKFTWKKSIWCYGTIFMYCIPWALVFQYCTYILLREIPGISLIKKI